MGQTLRDAALDRALRDARAYPIAYYQPRVTTLPFHMDCVHRTRFLLGGNRSSKSFSLIAEIVMAITGIESIYTPGACSKFRKPPLMVRHWCDGLKRVVPGVLLPIYYQLLPPSMLDESKGSGGFNKGDGTLHLTNGSWVQFLSYSMPARAGVAAELHVVGFDEPPTEDLYNSQYARVSTTGGHLLGAMTLDEHRATHSIQWVDRRIIRRENADGSHAPHVEWWQIDAWTNFAAMIAEAETPEEAAAIQSGYDNWANGLSDEEADVVLYGKGGYLTGLVYSDFRESTHASYDLVAPAEFPELVRKGYGEIRCGLDYGMNHPTAMVWIYRHKRPAIPSLQLAEDDCIVYRVYKKAGLRIKQNIARIRHLSTDAKGRLEPVLAVWADESIWSDDGKEGLNVGQTFVRDLKPWPVRRQAFRKKKSGHERIRQMLAARGGATPWPQLRLCKGVCKPLVTEMYEYHYVAESYRTGKSPDETNDLNDDAVDALRYGVISIPAARVRKGPQLPGAQRHPVTGMPMSSYVPLRRLVARGR